MAAAKLKSFWYQHCSWKGCSGTGRAPQETLTEKWFVLSIERGRVGGRKFWDRDSSGKPDSRSGYGSCREAPQHQLQAQGHQGRCSLSSNRTSTALSCDPGSSLWHPCLLQAAVGGISLPGKGVATGMQWYFSNETVAQALSLPSGGVWCLSITRGSPQTSPGGNLEHVLHPAFSHFIWGFSFPTP